jgi:archaellum component FlaC
MAVYQLKEARMENTSDKKTEETNTKQPANQSVATPDENKGELLAELQKNIMAKDKQIESLKNSSGTFKEDINRLNVSLEKAVKSYRNMVVKAHPEIPEELISGKTVDEIDTALEQAKKIVTRVKQSLEKEAVPDDVPVGAPTRTRENADKLSPREKIQYAIGGN